MYYPGEWMTEAVVSLARGIVEANTPIQLPVLADALEDAGCASSMVLADLRSTSEFVLASHGMRYARALADPEKTLSEQALTDAARRVAAARYSLWARCGVTGAAGMSLAELTRHITRKRPKGSGSKKELAERLRDRLDELAVRRWARATAGQRALKRAVEQTTREVEVALEAVQGAARERLLGVSKVIRTVLDAIHGGHASCDGGRVTASSYKYHWSTTVAYAIRQRDGTVRLTINRNPHATVTATVTATAAVWRAVARAHQQAGSVA